MNNDRLSPKGTHHHVQKEEEYLWGVWNMPLPPFNHNGCVIDLHSFNLSDFSPLQFDTVNANSLNRPVSRRGKIASIIWNERFDWEVHSSIARSCLYSMFLILGHVNHVTSFSEVHTLFYSCRKFCYLTIYFSFLVYRKVVYSFFHQAGRFKASQPPIVSVVWA